MFIYNRYIHELNRSMSRRVSSAVLVLSTTMPSLARGYRCDAATIMSLMSFFCALVNKLARRGNFFMLEMLVHHVITGESPPTPPPTTIAPPLSSAAFHLPSSQRDTPTIKLYKTSGSAQAPNMNSALEGGGETGAHQGP